VNDSAKDPIPSDQHDPDPYAAIWDYTRAHVAVLREGWGCGEDEPAGRLLEIARQAKFLTARHLDAIASPEPAKSTDLAEITRGAAEMTLYALVTLAYLTDAPDAEFMNTLRHQRQGLDRFTSLLHSPISTSTPTA
jgi:hypothetical protein